MFLALQITLLISVTSASAIENFIGTWTPGLTFPNQPRTPFCDKLSITVDDAIKCTCDGTPVAITSIKRLDALYSFIPDQKTPTIVVETSSDVPKALKKRCVCEGMPGMYVQQVVFRAIDDNYFVQYEQRHGMAYTEDMAYSGTLFAKVLPKSLAELKRVYESIDDLRGKPGHLVCPASYPEA